MFLKEIAVTSGDLDGPLDLACDANCRGVQTYSAEQATSPDARWTQCFVGKDSICTDASLVSGTQHWHRVRAIGPAGPSASSGRASKRAT